MKEFSAQEAAIAPVKDILVGDTTAGVAFLIFTTITTTCPAIAISEATSL
ncbi:MAG: hypothetical protein AAF915_28190 [Cyanobacteria bacterium P01_D01_bin.50]